MNKLLEISLLASLCLGCASGPVLNKPGGDSDISAQFEGAPVWVQGNCGRYLKDPKVLCARGSYGGSRNVSLLQTQSLANARAELASVLKLKVKALVKQAMGVANVSTSESKAASDEQVAGNASIQVANETLSGSRMEETWVNKQGTMFTLVVLDVDLVKDSLGKLANLNAEAKAAAIKNADKLFNELESRTAEAQ